MSSVVKDNLSRIQHLYKDKVILLTGGTGFLGMILIEKLLRSCPDIRCIYLLVREKNGSSPEDRLKKLVNNTVFFRLKKEQPRFSEKLAVIQGDLHKPKLGLSLNDEAMLIQLVDILFHSAATIKFNEKLKLAIETNVAATKEICHLAQQMVNLKAFVYISTAFSNCERDLIPEKVEPPVVCPDKLIGLAELLDERQLDKIAPSLLHPKPNTYIFSKSAAENVVFKCRTSLPIAILRPSIVGAAAQEPAPGWINNTQGSAGTVAAVSAGLMHTMISKLHKQANIVPVDNVVNAIIALGYAIASQNWQCSKDEEGVPIINFVAKSYNCMTWGDFSHLLVKYVYEYPSQNLIWYPFLVTPENRWSSYIQKTLLHHLPATLIDVVTAKCGSPTKLRRIYQQLDKYEEVVSYFSTRQFVFEENNADILWSLIEPQDKKLFPFQMADMKWTEYMKNYVLGCRRYLLKEDDSTLARSRIKTKGLYSIHLMAKGALLLMAWKVSWYILTLLRRTLLR